MSELFGEAAVRLFGAAATLLGWQPDEFWNATPAELAAALQPQIGLPDVPAPSDIQSLQARFPDDVRSKDG